MFVNTDIEFQLNISSFDRVTALNEVNADILTLYVPGCFVHLLLILYQMECYEAVTYCQHSHTSIKNDH